MTRALLALAVALVASLGANIYLWVSRHEEAPAPVVATAAPARAAAPAHHDSAPVLPPPSTKEDLSQVDRATLERRLIDAETRLDALLPPKEKFERGEPAPDVEARVRPVLDKLGFTIECRAMVCKVATKPNPPDDWMHTLQNDPGVHLFASGFAFGPDGVFMTVAPPEAAAARQWLIAIRSALYDGAALAECKARNPTAGDLVLHLTRDKGRVAVTTTGSLANQGGGVCIRRVLEDIVVATPLPPEVVELPDWPMRVTVP